MSQFWATLFSSLHGPGRQFCTKSATATTDENFFVLYPTAVSRSVWPDLAKFRHFGIMLKNFGHFERVHFVFGKIWNLLWQILYASAQFFSFVNAQILKKNNRAIWSHWSRSSCIESSWVALRSFDSVKSVWPDWKIWRHLGEFLKSKVAKIYGEKNHFSTKNIAPWLCLCLPSCGPRFNSQAHSLRFFSMCT